MTPAGLVIMLAVQPIDMRRSFDGLALAVKEHLGKDPLSERAMFAFINSRRDMMKILWRDSSGWCLLGKRLDTRIIPQPKDIPPGQKSIVVDARVLQSLLEGTERVRRVRNVVHDARAAATRAREEISRSKPQLSTRNRR